MPLKYAYFNCLLENPWSTLHNSAVCNTNAYNYTCNQLIVFDFILRWNLILQLTRLLYIFPNNCTFDIPPTLSLWHLGHLQPPPTNERDNICSRGWGDMNQEFHESLNRARSLSALDTPSILLLQAFRLLVNDGKSGWHGPHLASRSHYPFHTVTGFRLFQLLVNSARTRLPTASVVSR